MRILQITAGAAGMYCGSCLRDNALAAELMAQGHDVTLVPLYTPTLTDEPNVSHNRVFFGGISVYLQQHSGFFRKTPWLVDRLWDSSLALKAAVRRSIPTNPQWLGKLTVSMLNGEDGNHRKELKKLIQWLQDEPRPDIINLPNSLLIGLAGPLKKALGVPVCCTLQGEDLYLDGLLEPYRSQSLELIRHQIDTVDQFLAVSEYYVGYMSRYLGIPERRMDVVPLGIKLDEFEPVARSRHHFTIGYLARVAPEKGLHLLCDAYRRLRKDCDLPVSSLEVAGYLAPEHKPYLAGIEKQMKEWGLDREFRYHGVLDRRRKIEFLQRLDVLSVPSVYADPKGLYVLEAMACGVPVVQPRHGAFPEMVEKTRGGVLVDPNDAGRLAEGILNLWRNAALRQDLGRMGAEGIRRHYSVRNMAEAALTVYQRLQNPLAISAPVA